MRVSELMNLLIQSSMIVVSFPSVMSADGDFQLDGNGSQFIGNLFREIGGSWMGKN